MVDIARIVAKLTAPIKRRVALMIGRAVLLAVDDNKACQTVQIRALNGEVLDTVERPTQYGFTSHPHFGADVVLLACGGSRDNGLAICVGDRRYRLTGLMKGEVALHDDLNQKVHLTRSGIVIETPLNGLIKAGGVLRLEADGLELHGRTYLQSDVHGKGERETWAGGTTYDTDSFQMGATGNTTEHGLDQPAIPTDHPEGH